MEKITNKNVDLICDIEEEEVPLGIILCATRGSASISPTEQRAIDLAKEKNYTLVFLYIVSTSFLDITAAPIVVDVNDELSDMGEFLLLLVKERAEQQGVSVRTMIRKGEVRDEIKEVAAVICADLVVLGRPAGEGSAFQIASLEEFAREIEADTDAEVIIV